MNRSQLFNKEDPAAEPLSPPRHTSQADISARLRADIDASANTLTKRGFLGEYDAVHNLKPAAALNHLRKAVQRLPEKDREALPSVFKDGDIRGDWAYLRTHPKTKDITSDPAITALLGGNYKKIGTIESLWHFPLAPGPFITGAKRGAQNFSFGREVPLNAEKLKDPDTQARLNVLDSQRSEDFRYIEQIKRHTPFPRLSNPIQSFQINFGDTAGGMGASLLTPEALALGASGAVGGAAFAGVGALGGGLGGLTTGAAVAQGRSAAGQVAWDVYQAQAEEHKDESLAITAGIETWVTSTLLELAGMKGLAKGLGPTIHKGLASVAAKAAPKASAQVTAVMAEQGMEGLTARFVGRVASHTAPEIVTEGLQEGAEALAQRRAGLSYNKRYQHLGFLSAVPTWSDILDAAGAGAKQAAWGGAGLGLIGPSLKTLSEYSAMKAKGQEVEVEQVETAIKELGGGNERLKNLSVDEAGALVDYAGDVAGLTLRKANIEKANQNLRRNVKQAADIIRKDKELGNNPQLAESLLKDLSEDQPAEAYLNARTLDSLFQKALTSENPQVDFEPATFLESLGVGEDAFAEALAEDSDILIDLNAMPYVVQAGIWDDVVEMMTVEPLQITAEMQADLENLKPPVILPRPNADISPKTLNNIQDRLKAAGRSKGEARREAELWSRMAGNLARITGAKPDAVAEKVWFAKEAKVDGSLNQASRYQDARGRTDFLSDGGYRVVFGAEADATTAIHEFEHVFIAETQRIVKLSEKDIADQAAHEQLKTDLAALEDWAGVKGGQWTVENHERAAQGFERYFMEGHAPTKALRNIFSRMKSWLLKVYKELRDIGEPLTDEVRRVFDRQLASEEEIAAESWRTEPVFDLTDMEQAVDPQTWAEYQEAVQKAREAAQGEIVNFRNAEHERLVKQWRHDGKKEARQDPRQMHFSEMVKAGGVNKASLDAAGYDQTAVDALQKKRPGLVTLAGANGIDEFAALYGFEYADSFVQELMNTPTIDEMAGQYVAEQEALYADYFDADPIITDAEIDLWTKERDLWAQVMADAPHKKTARPWKGAKNFIDRMTGVKPVDEIAAKNMADLKAGLKAQTRAARAGFQEGENAGKAKGYKRGGVEGYYAGRGVARAEALDKRLELAVRLKSLAAIKMDIVKTEAGWRRLIKQKQASLDARGGLLPEFHAQIKNLLAGAGLGKEVGSASDFASFITQLETDRTPLAVAGWIKSGPWPVWENGQRAGTRKTFRSLSYEQFTELKTAVANLAFLGRRQKQVMLNGRLTDENQVANDLITSIGENHEIKKPKTQGEILQEAGNPKGPVKVLMDALSGYMSSVIKTETMARRLDGGQYDGLAQKLIYRPLNEAHEKGQALTADLIEGKLKQVVDSTVGGKALLKWRAEKKPVPGVSQILTTEQRIMIALNSGNADNLKAVRNYELGENGQLLSDAQHQAILDSLTYEEWQFVQGVWDFMDNEMFPRLNELTLKTKGVPLKKVEATPVFTKYEEMRGGYFPFKFDAAMSERAAHLGNSAQPTLNSPGLYARPGTQAGATIERSGTSYADLVPILNIGVLIRSLNENIHDLTHREAVNDVWRMIKRPDVKQAINGVLGEHYWVQVQRWLQEVAAPEQVGDAGGRNILKWIRGNTSLAAMGLKGSVMLCQITGISQSIHKLGAKWTMVGLKEYFVGRPSHIKKTTDLIYEKSIALRTRNHTSHDRDAHDVLATRNPLAKSLKDEYAEIAFWPIAMLDQAVANPVWLGAYLKALKADGKSEADAVYYADAIVRTTQPTGLTKDMSRAQRGWGYGDAGKLLTMFSTFFSGTQNLIWEQFHETRGDFKKGDYAKGTYKAGRAFILLALLPALMEALIKDGLPEDEDDLKSIAAGSVSYTIGGLPVVKDAVSYLIGDSYSFRPAPVIESVGAILRAPGGLADIYEGETTKGTKRLIRGLGPLTGLPSGQLSTTFKGVEDWEENEGWEAVYRLLVREPPK